MHYMSVCAKALALCLILKIAVSFCDYSGKSKPPMFGDYEAQRHWMEISFNLPIKDWYRNTPDNDLLYWGLDYPPLTAYHSWLMGSIANIINPEYVKLNDSRGYESIGHKAFMRTTVLVSDFFIYSLGFCVYAVTACSMLKNFRLYGDGGSSALRRLLYCGLTFPGLVLVDHGHFQYNAVSLGFTLLAVICLIQGHDFLCAILYCLAFSYKQMALYYSLPFFFYYLGRFHKECRNSTVEAVSKLTGIGTSVMITLSVVWFPFIWDKDLLRQVLRRVFPLNRGLFEDKVSNIWCVINIVYKLKNIPQETMAFICVILTLLACLPSCLDLFLNPGKEKFVYSLINCSLAFFLFSYQVHEKTILFACLPVCLVLGHRPVHCSWFLTLATLSMLPLLAKDNLLIATFVTVATHLMLLSFQYSIFSPKVLSNELMIGIRKFPKLLYAFYICALAINPVLAIMSEFSLPPPPPKLPHLYPLAISAFSALQFVLFYAYFNYTQIVAFKLVKKGKKYR